jgi:hypothetical protein
LSRFLANWRQFFCKATDASHDYCEAAGLMALSSVALGRRSLSLGRGLQPNLFLMLAGESSVARKSTSVSLARQLLEEVDPTRVGPRDYTVEGLLKWMMEKDPQTGKSKNKVILFAEEFGADLARATAYGPTMTADFCALYDGQSFEKVRAKAAPFFIDKPRLNLFAASAFHMLTSYLHTRDWLSGYMMRFLYVVPTSSRTPFTLAPAWPKVEFDAAVVSMKVLRDDLKRQYLTMDFDGNARSAFSQWAVSVTKYAQTAQNEAFFIYCSRFIVNVQKVALLYQLDIDPMQPISLAAVQQAIQFASNVCWPSFVTTLQKTTRDDVSFVQLSVLHMLRSGPLSRVQLEPIHRGPAFRKAMDYLVWSGAVVERKSGEQSLYMLP